MSVTDRILKCESEHVADEPELLEVGQVEGVGVEQLDVVVVEREVVAVGHEDVPASEVAERVSDESDRSLEVEVAREVGGRLQVLDGQGEDVEAVAVGDDVDAAKPSDDSAATPQWCWKREISLN